MAHENKEEVCILTTKFWTNGSERRHLDGLFIAIGFDQECNEGQDSVSHVEASQVDEIQEILVLDREPS